MGKKESFLSNEIVESGAVENDNSIMIKIN